MLLGNRVGSGMEKWECFLFSGKGPERCLRSIQQHWASLQQVAVEMMVQSGENVLFPSVHCSPLDSSRLSSGQVVDVCVSHQGKKEC